jgi:hypothetical protein
MTIVFVSTLERATYDREVKTIVLAQSDRRHEHVGLPIDQELPSLGKRIRQKHFKTARAERRRQRGTQRRLGGY